MPDRSIAPSNPGRQDNGDPHSQMGRLRLRGALGRDAEIHGAVSIAG